MKIFENLDNVRLTKTFKDFLRWQRERSAVSKELTYSVPHCPNKEIEFLKENRSEGSLTWIGHATFLIQVGGLNILTDPVWSDRMGLQKRLAGPGIPLDHLPPIDIVVISHNHYDHLDFWTVSKLKGNPLCLVPQGLASLFKSKGLSRVVELCWWEERILESVELVFVPAQHWSKRGLWDTNASHWGGWLIKEKTASSFIYFVGDSGYFRGFREIGRKYPIDYMLAPIGAYAPEWFMHIQHVTPEEAVQAFLDAKAENFVPMHYDAFRLGDDTPYEAVTRLKAHWEKQNLDSTGLKIMSLGETLKF